MSIKITHKFNHSNIIHNFGYNIRALTVPVRAGIIGKLYPSREFVNELPQQFGNVRLIWNKFCGWLKKQYRVRKAYCKRHHINFSKMRPKQRKEAYRSLPKILQQPSEATLDKVLRDSKQKWPWLKKSDSRALQLEIKNLLKTIKQASSGKCRQPRFKSRKSHCQSYTTDTASLQSKNFMHGHTKIKLPKLGTVKVHFNMPLVGVIQQATISLRPNGSYYISLSVKCESQILPKTHHVVGIDVGLDDLAILSNGMKFNFKYYSKAGEGYKHEWEIIRARRYRHAEKCIHQDTHYQKQHPNFHVKTLNEYSNYQKVRRKVAKINYHIRNQRYDYLQKLTTWLVRHFDLIAVENIKVQDMNKNHHLSRAEANACWYKFRQMLAYKCHWYGKILEVVNKDYTSQVCHTCGMQTGKKPLQLRYFKCPFCKTEQDRDVNASINILRLGLEQAMANNWTSALKPLPQVHLSKPSVPKKNASFSD